MTQVKESVTALVWAGKSDFEMVALPRPCLRKGESLIRLTAATICGSDRHTVAGRRVQPSPSVLGHEGVGIVEQTRNLRLDCGQRVVFSVTAPCMKCKKCQAGYTAKCENVLKTGHESFKGLWPMSGTYATHLVLRNNQAVIEVPDALSDAVASIASCAGATVMAAREAAKSMLGARVMVIGLGMLGLIAVDEAVRAGASHIIGVDPHPQRRRWAMTIGAHRAVHPDTLSRAEVANSSDIAFEFSGTQAGTETCIGSLDIGGYAVLAGTVMPSPNLHIDPEWVVRGWRTITGIHNYEPRHLEQAVGSLRNSLIPWDEVVSKPMGLKEVPGSLLTGHKTCLRDFVVLA